MSVVEGVIQPGEGTAAALKICRRQNGFNWPVYVWLAGLVLIAFAAGVVIDFVAIPLGWPHGTDAVICAVIFLVAWKLSRPLYLRMATKRFRRRRSALGLPDELPVQVYPTDEAFHYDCAGSRSQITWSVITEIFPLDGYWIVSANSAANYIPKRFFADRQSEQSFVSDVLRRMPLEAQARSKAAAAFCNAA